MKPMVKTRHEVKRSSSGRRRGVVDLAPPCLLALLVLLAGLVAGAVPAAGRGARPDLAGGASSRSVANAGTLPPRTPVAISGEEVRLQFFVAHQFSTRTPRQLLNGALVTLYIDEAIERGATREEARAGANELMYSLNNIHMPDDDSATSVDILAESVEHIQALAGDIPFADNVIIRFQHEVVEPLQEEQREAALKADGLYVMADQQDKIAAWSEHYIDIYSTAFSWDSSDPDKAWVWNTSVGSENNSRTDDSVDTIKLFNPVLAVQDDVLALLDGQGRLITDLGTLKDLTAARFVEITGLLAAANDQLFKMNAFQGNMLDYLKRAEDARLKAELEESQRQERERRLAGEKAGLFLLTQFIGGFDPKAAKQISAVGTATIDIASAIGKWSTSMAQPKQVSILGLDFLNADSLSACATIVGAITTMIQAFADQPSPEQVILDQVVALREEVQAMRDEMRLRFDRVDAALQTIFDNMMNQFAVIDANFGELDVEVYEMHQQLLDIDADLHRFEGDMFNLLGEMSRADLWEEINFAVDYRTTYPGSAMPLLKWQEEENFFYSYATNEARTLHTAPFGAPPYGFQAVLDQLQSYDIDANLNFLSAVADDWWDTSLLSHEATNPRDWALAARAYSRLVGEWPEYAAGLNPGRAVAVAYVGQRLQDELTQIALKPTPDGDLVLADVLDEYGSAIDYLDAQLESFEGKYRYDPVSGVDCLSEEGIEQQLTTYEILNRRANGTQSLVDHLNAESPIPAAGSDVGTLVWRGPDGATTVWPENLSLPNPYKLCWAMGDPLANICWDAVFTSGPFVNPKTGQPYGTVRLRVMYRLADTIVAYRQYSSSITGYSSATTWATSNWLVRPGYPSGLKGLMAGLPDQYNPTGVTLAESRAGDLLGDLRGAMCGLVAQDLADYEHKTPNEEEFGYVKDAVVRVRATKALIEAILGIALPRTLQGDDVMQSLLYGAEQIPGGTLRPLADGALNIPLPAELQAWYNAARHGTESPRPDIRQFAHGRLDILKQRVALYQELIRTGQLSDVMPVLETATARAGLTGLAIDAAAAADNWEPTTTTASLYSMNGIYLDHNQTVVLSAADTGYSGVANTFYTIDGGQQLTYAGPFVVAGEGSHTVTYWSIDNAGNGELPQTGYVSIDLTHPTITDNADALPHAVFALVLTANDSLSGISTVQYRIDGGAWKTGDFVTLKCYGKRTAYSTGTHTVEYKATDVAGNITSGSCQVILAR